MLNWRIDPLLVDPQPVPWPHWVTANQIIAQKSSTRVPPLFLQPQQLNFYGIMVRKSDFVKDSPSDRLLTRFPYLQLTPTLQKIVEVNLSRFGMKISQYSRGAESFSPLEGRKKIDRYISQNRLPLPFFRVLASLHSNETEFLLKHFTGATLESFRHVPFHFPLELTEPLAYFLGACAGDGSLTPKQVRICDGHQDYMQRLYDLISKLTATTPEFRSKAAGKAWLVILKSKWFARLVHFLTDQPFGRKYDTLSLPQIFHVLPNPEALENRYIQGLFDTDGSCHAASRTICLTTKSAALLKDLEANLSQKQIPYRSYLDNGMVYRLFIRRPGALAFASQIGFLSPAKQQALCTSLKSSPGSTEYCGVKPEALTPSSKYLNFSLLPKLLVADFYDYLRAFLDSVERSQWSRVGAKNLRDRRRWLQSGRVPFPVVAQVAVYRDVDIYAELKDFQARFAYPYAKYTVALPFQVTPALEEVLPYLSPFQEGLIVTSGTYRNLVKRPPKEIAEKAAHLFDVSSTSFQCYDGRYYKIVNELLRDYVTTFFQHEKAWQTPSPQEFKNLVDQWNQIL